eukprot:3009780-Rhodomonas_salina.1
MRHLNQQRRRTATGSMTLPKTMVESSALDPPLTTTHLPLSARRISSILNAYMKHLSGRSVSPIHETFPTGGRRHRSVAHSSYQIESDLDPSAAAAIMMEVGGARDKFPGDASSRCSEPPAFDVTSQKHATPRDNTEQAYPRWLLSSCAYR